MMGDGSGTPAPPDGRASAAGVRLTTVRHNSLILKGAATGRLYHFRASAQLDVDARDAGGLLQGGRVRKVVADE